MNNNAIDYLLELAEKNNCNKWLSYVIRFFIENKGVIDDSIKEDLADYLLQRKELPKIESVSTNFNLNSEKVVLKKLRHHSGVNALFDEQEIIFSPQLNIVYGLNGTGKSSYFRILNNMVGYAIPKNILPNVYDSSPKNINVDIEYSLDNINKSSVRWSNDSDNISDLQSIRVFDSEYTNKYLQKRDSDVLLIKPYALSYFSEISDLITEVKEIAKEKIKSNEKLLPNIDLEKTTESFKEFLNKDSFQEEDIIKIDSFKDFSLEERKLLENVKESINNLKKENPEDAIKLNEIKLKKLQKIESDFNTLIILFESVTLN